MSRYEQVRDTLADALGPVAAYVERAHATIDTSDPAQAGRARHVAQIETLIEAVADFGALVDARMTGPNWQRLAYRAIEQFAPPPENPPPFLARCQAFLNSPRMQARLNLPLEERQRLAEITSHHVPVPAHILALFPDHARPV